MSKLNNCWLASFVNRWHTNPHLLNTNDRIDGHSMRVTMIAFYLYPQLSREGILNALTHDLGEHAVGDMAHDVKRENPAISMCLGDMELMALTDLGLAPAYLNKYETDIIKLADQLDAILWVNHHKPELMKQFKWKNQVEAVLIQAELLKVELTVNRAFNDADLWRNQR